MLRTAGVMSSRTVWRPGIGRPSGASGCLARTFEPPAAAGQQQPKENEMKTERMGIPIVPARLWKPVFVACASFLLGSGLNANNKTKPAELPARVIAHVPLAAPPGSQMVLQKQENKYFLYIQLASKQGYMVVDVSKPELPNLVNRQASGDDSTAGRLEVVGPGVGVAEVPNTGVKPAAQTTESPTETVKILDLSDPAHPKTLQTFKGVTSVLDDSVRGLLFLTNNEGLWVLKHNREQLAPKRKMPPCDSSSALAAMPPECE